MAEFKATRAQLGGGIKLPIESGVVVRVAPNPVSRVRLVGMFFDLNKCFLLPFAMPGIQDVKDEYNQHPNSNLLIVGHTDTSGDDESNLTLSLERAEAMEAYLTDRVDPWEAFFHDDKPAIKRWGTREVQLMLTVLPKGGTAFFDGKPDGKGNLATTEAITAFQESEGLEQDGIAGPITRKRMIEKYMDLDGTFVPNGPANNITVTTHGCGENFPAVHFENGAHSQEDRRVELFFFDGPITPPPPAGRKSKKGSTEYPQWLAQVTETVDVSGGNDLPQTLSLRLHDAAVVPIANAVFKVTIGNEARPLATAAGDGFADIDLPPFCPAKITIEWGPPGSAEPLPFRTDIIPECATGDDEQKAIARLHNLGYSSELPLDTAVKAFQLDYAVDDAPQPLGLSGGKLPAKTRKKLFDIYDNEDCLATP